MRHNIFVMIWIFTISLSLIPKGPINNIPALVQVMDGTDKATNHYLKQWWLVYWCIYAPLSVNKLITP